MEWSSYVHEECHGVECQPRYRVEIFRSGVTRPGSGGAAVASRLKPRENSLSLQFLRATKAELHLKTSWAILVRSCHISMRF